MLPSRSLVRALLLTLLAAPVAAQATLRITDIDLHVGEVPNGRRAAYPSHKVFVGDKASIDALLFHDGNVQGWSTSFTTTAPVTGVAQHAPQSGLLKGPDTHLVGVGFATFTAAGRYKLDVTIRSGAGDVTGSFDIDVVELQAVVAPVSVACLAPAVQWASPAVNGQICLNQPATLRVNPTFHGCAPNTVDIYVEAKGGAAWALLGSRTAAPWSVTHTFADAGPVRLKVVARDKNGAKAEAVITATVSQCLDASKFKH
jgi:hypothetical protein